jgi:uncharacterized repeat protein (TIGR01451 family)
MNVFHGWLLAAALACGLGFPAAAPAAPPPAGTAISNTATASYVDSTSGLSVRLSSNTVSTVVQPLEALLLTSGQTITATASSGFTLPHQLTNSGNVSTTYALTLSETAGSFTPTGLELVEDVNGNGVADPGEPVLAGGATVTLAPGAVLNLLITGTVPPSAAVGQSAQLRLAAKSAVQGATASNTDTIDVVSGPVITVTKNASNSTPAQGGSITYTINAVNSGTTAAGGTPVTVNGAPVMLFVLRDGVPANTTFAMANAGTTGAQLLYHHLGDPAGSYVTTAPAASATDGIAWTLPTLGSGANLAGSFTVLVNGNAAGSLANTAFADFNGLGANLTVASNPVQLALPAFAPTIAFFTNGSYGNPVQQAPLGAQLFVQVNVAQCNTNPSAILTHPITLVSSKTGDAETFTATETAPNTGIFRILPFVPTQSAATHAVVSGDGILEVLPNDRVVASLSGCGINPVTTTLLIDPSGVVFDSKTNAPVAGATVSLIDVTGAANGGNAGGPATVFAADGVTPAPSTLTTGSDGTYLFPFVGASSYRLVVVPPGGYVFPSKLPVGLLPPGRNIDAAGSYGKPFNLTVKGGALLLDVPLDAGAVGGLFVQKIANKSVAAVGDFVDYTVNLNNNTGVAMANVVLDDALPAGFAYLPGSARLNGAPLTNPSGGAGPALVFGIGTIEPGAQTVLSYRVRIGPAGASGSGVNTAQAHSGPTTSNLASATVQVSGSALSTKAYLIGKVYADCNDNRWQDPGEPGLPGVRIYLDNGTYAVTDEEGKYSLYGLTPRTSVAKLDTTTLPDGVRLEILDNRNAGDAGSRFVDLQNGELAKADFAVAGCTERLRDQIAARRAQVQGRPSEVARAAAAQIKVNAAATADARTLPASGLIGQPANGRPTESTAAVAPILPAALRAPAGAAPAPSPAPATAGSGPAALEELLPKLSPKLGFIDLVDDQVVPAAQIHVRVKGPLGTHFALSVNDRVVAESQVGQRSSLESRGIAAWEYIGVDLVAGDNTVEIAMLDDFGNRRGSSRIHVIAPGRLAQIKLEVPERSDADVQKPVDVVVHLLDARGTPVTSRTPLTLESTLGDWQTADLDPKEPGTQVFLEGGVGHYALLAPATPGKSALRVSSGPVHAEAELIFMPHLRPMIAAGLIEGVVSLRNLDPSRLTPAQTGDSFEQAISSASRSFDAGKGNEAGHASLFLKGKVLGSDLLTMSYDSDKPSDTQMFRDIQPDQFYPVYGDSSVKGFDAQSTSKLYVRLDHGTSYGVYGDFSTQSDNPARLLTQYSRALNGAKTHLEDGRFTLDGFASYTNSTQVIDELPANGTSGPYQLSAPNPVLNSQRVDIITRDRNQPTIVLNDVSLSQFTDYAVEPFTAQILFKAPIPSFDANLNPIYIRVSYEVNNGGPSYWVAGIDLREQLARDFGVGGTYIRDANPVDHMQLGGANFVWKPNPQTSLVGEFAESDSDLAGTGTAHRIEFKHNDAAVQARLYAVQTDPEFNNPSSTFNAGATEYGAKTSFAIDAKDRILFDALKSQSATGALLSPGSIPLTNLTPTVATGAGEREGESLAYERALPAHVKLTAGLRHVKSDDQPTQTLATGAVPNDFTSARLRVDAPVPDLPKANAFAQYEEALDNTDRKDTTLGATYQMSPTTKFYATHQTSNSLTGDYGLNPSQQDMATVVGIDTTYLQNAKMFDEYRVGDGIDGRSATAAVGLRNLWNLEPGLGLSTSIQQVHPVSGVVTENSTALTGALEYTANPLWKASTRIEWSKAETSQTWLASLSAAAKLGTDLTALARGVYNEQIADTAGTGSNYLRQIQVGMAYRPVDNDVWNALAWIEHKRTEMGSLGAGLDTDEAANILSTNVNFQVNPDWVIDGRYAVKRATDFLGGLDTAYTAQLVGARSIWDLNAHWDVGLQSFVEFGGNGGSGRQQAAGFEVGYLVMKNLWLSIGYNVTGFTDRDLASEDYTQKAFYLRLRIKFDENLFKPRNNAEPIPAGATVMQ